MKPPALAMAMTTFASCVAASSARSETAHRVDLARLGIQCHLQESRSVGIQEAGTADWNGYGAEPLRKASLQNAEFLLRSFGLGAAHPSLGASNAGWVTMQWARSATWTLSLMITDDGLIHWAALLGSSRSSGTMPLNAAAVQELLKTINRVMKP
jgi:hypothetical protein